MASATGGGAVITPKRMAAQWQHTLHKLHLNVWNFEVKAGKVAQEIFQKSFDLKKFNSNDAKPWAQRSQYSKGTHPLMVQTSSLKNSIKWKHKATRPGEATGVSIYTDPNAFGNTASHKGFCYAEIHNGPGHNGTKDWSTSTVSDGRLRRDRVRNMPQRQFIGDSSVLDDELKKLSVMIFKGFPM